MADRSIDIGEFTSILEELGRSFSEKETSKLLLLMAQRVGVLLEQVSREYPAQKSQPLPRIHQRTSTSGTPFTSKFKSRKQQGFFFASLKEGRIKVPYQRTGQLARTTVSAAKLDSNTEASVRLGSNLDYAPRVKGSPEAPNPDLRQTQMHRDGGWTTYEDDVNRAMPFIQETVDKAVADFVAGIFDNL